MLGKLWSEIDQKSPGSCRNRLVPPSGQSELGSSARSERRRSRPGGDQPTGRKYVNCPVTRRVTPVRTCVGCRVRGAKSDLLRVVAIDGTVVVDHRGKLPGRGAHMHPNPVCLDLAERRRAFPRALRVSGPLDLTPLRTYVEAQVVRRTTDDQVGTSNR